jgi:HK97 family phage major capsid protein
MEHTIQELEKLVSAKIALCESIRSSAKNESRSMTSSELESFDTYMTEIESTVREIELRKMQGRISGSNYEIPRPSVSSSTSEFRSLGEALQCIKNASNASLPVDSRLYRTMTESTPSDGGFALSTGYSSELLKAAFDNSNLAKYCYTVEISTNSASMAFPAYDETNRTASRMGGCVGYFLGENQAITPSAPKLRSLQLTLHKLCVLTYSSSELAQDVVVLEKMIRESFAAEVGFQLDRCILNGSGTGEGLGLLRANCLVTVDPEVGQSSSEIQLSNLTKMYSRLLPGSAKTAVWIIAQSVLPALLELGISVGVGGSAGIFLAANNAANQPQNQLLGCPIIINEQSPALGTKGDIILADLTRGMILLTKGTTRVESSVHFLFNQDTSTFRGITRFDNQPFLASAVTPAVGSNTLSHFVTLATR